MTHDRYNDLDLQKGMQASSLDGKPNQPYFCKLPTTVQAAGGLILGDLFFGKFETDKGEEKLAVVFGVIAAKFILPFNENFLQYAAIRDQEYEPDQNIEIDEETPHQDIRSDQLVYAQIPMVSELTKDDEDFRDKLRQEAVVYFIQVAQGYGVGLNRLTVSFIDVMIGNGISFSYPGVAN